MRRLMIWVGVVVVALVGYLMLWPVPIDPEAWVPPPAPALEGVYAVNQALASIERLGADAVHAAEDVASQGDVIQEPSLMLTFER